MFLLNDFLDHPFRIVVAFFLFAAVSTVPAEAEPVGFSPIVEANQSFGMYGIQEPAYGKWGYSMKVSQNVWSNDFTATSLGVMQSFSGYSLDDQTLYGGDDELSWDTGLYGVAGQTFFPGAGRRLYLGVEFFFGRNTRRISGTTKWHYLNWMNRHTDKSRFFDWGSILKIGYMVNSSIGVHGLTRMSLRGFTDGDGGRLIDGDRSGSDTKIYAGLGMVIHTGANDP